MITSKKFLLPAIYHTKCQFSSLKRFTTRIGERFDKIPFNKRFTLQTLGNIVKELESDTERAVIDQNIAEKLLIAKDLRRVEEQVESLEEFDPDRAMAEDFKNLLEQTKKIGFDVNGVEIFQVDEFPEPFRRMNWTFFNADKADAQKYGVPFGIYIKKDVAIPIYTAFHIAHELIHVAIGLKGADKIARGLEEGIAELLGCIFLFSRLKGYSLTANLLIYNRLGYPPNQIWDVYLDNLRQAIFLYHRFGLAGLKELVHDGREKIKEVEKVMLKGDYDKIKLTKGEWDSGVDCLTSLVLTFPRNYVVSPLAKYISEFMEKGAKVKDIINNHNLEPSEGKEAIEELNRKLFLIVIKNGIISNSDMDTISDETVLRYLLE